MPAVPLEDPRRFTKVDADGTPLWFDPAAVVAMEPRGERNPGAPGESVPYRMHLAGGQMIELAAPIAVEALKRLGLSPRSKVQGPKSKKADAPREAAGLTVSPTVKAKGHPEGTRRQASGKKRRKQPPASPAGQIGRYLSRLLA